MIETDLETSCYRHVTSAIKEVLTRCTGTQGGIASLCLWRLETALDLRNKDNNETLQVDLTRVSEESVLW